MNNKNTNNTGGENPSFALERAANDYKNNPYSEYLKNPLKGDDAVDVTNDLDAKFAGKAEKTRSYEYIAWKWAELETKVLSALKGMPRPISKELVLLAAKKRSQKFEDLLFTIADEKMPSATMVNQAYEELDAMRSELNPSGAGKRDRLKQMISIETVRIPEIPPLAPAVFSKNLELSNPFMIDSLSLNPHVEDDLSVNPDAWNITTPDGVIAAAKECASVGLPVNDPMYQTVFSRLKNGVDPAKNKHLSNDVQRAWFINPASHAKELQGLSAEGAQFFEAFKELQNLRGQILVLKSKQLATLEKQQALDSDPIAHKVTDFVSANVDKFKKAIQDRDYATAGMYAVGVWAIWKSLTKLGVIGSGNAEGSMTKYFAYVAAAYVGHSFLKNAGYDVLKMTGLKDKNAEVKGTPLEGFKKLIDNDPEFKGKEIDSEILLRSSEVNLLKLHDLFKKSDKDGIQYIDPVNFADIFPVAAEVGPFDKGIGEKGLDDNTGNVNLSYSAKQREVIKLGRQLYLIAKAAPTVYQKTLQVDPSSPYLGMTYEQAITSSGARKLAKLRHLSFGVSKYTNSVREKGMLSKAGVEDAQKALDAAFEGKNANIRVEAGEAGHYPGYFMGMPVMFVENGDNYRIYLKENYGGKTQPGTGFLTEVPAEKGLYTAVKADEAIRKLSDKVKNKMIENGDGGLVFTPPVFDGKNWTSTVTLKENKRYNIPERTVNVMVVPRENGMMSVNIEGDNVDVTASKEGVIDSLNAKTLINRLSSQRDMAILAPLARKGLITFQKDLEEPKFLVKIVGKDVEVSFDKATSKFSITKEAQADLLKSNEFRSEYAESFNENERVNRTFTNLRRLVEDAPESFIINAGESAKKFVTGAQSNNWLAGLNADFMDGSVKEYYVNYILEFKKAEMLATFSGRLSEAATFEDAEKIQSAKLKSALDSLEKVAQKMATQNETFKRTGDHWTPEKFAQDVLEPIFKAGVSDRYAQALMSLDAALRAKYGEGSEIMHGGRTDKLRSMKRFADYASDVEGDDLNKATAIAIAGSDKAKDKEPFLKAGYLRYLRDEILNSPDANLMRYDEWVNSDRRQIKGIEPLEDVPPLGLASLKKLYDKKLDELRDTLFEVEGGNREAIEEYLKDVRVFQKTSDCKKMTKMKLKVEQDTFMKTQFETIGKAILADERCFPGIDVETQWEVLKYKIVNFF
ncbi:hypothetical protein COU74_03140 [Candidatus Peregrinibacteria bacterium CG10_big_fil_rev_8_21_14_0_10_36_19]|nr:MAG: hypothetical protein COU74_03140 [Candidatus Peregrinibacteria bacterium CG10_big_fil_rev_8_21_14_0_10_36_19]